MHGHFYKSKINSTNPTNKKLRGKFIRKISALERNTNNFLWDPAVNIKGREATAFLCGFCYLLFSMLPSSQHDELAIVSHYSAHKVSFAAILRLCVVGHTKCKMGPLALTVPSTFGLARVHNYEYRYDHRCLEALPPIFDSYV